ncbi:hypothetical protein [Rhodoplanes sp. Z2-YC6860]|uniref:hypothetical protein n=1 Tax=Rhodoplanes sp. Z2-YC6860 TaxID=674703 RepID=UPI00078BEB19|nr:hypothetical protein [Rhodoplanes sp. Z2-YC6860]AMN42690.1 hypothetical protein RHPLAN_42600 [Rhodoplanes sp. Z2-YC6860]
MEHKPLEQLRNQAAIVELEKRVAPSPRELRRMRLQRLAHVLAQHAGPVTLLTRIEYLPEPDRLPLRIDNSPLEIAYRDPVLRAQGLAGDRLADGMTFFDLSQAEVHYLLCDCHYSGMITGDMIAARARSVANRVSIGEMLAKVGGSLRQWFGRG